MVNRRDFVMAAAGAGAMLGVARRVAGAGAGMYVSLNGSLTGGKVGWPEFARLAASTGFSGVDVSLGAAMKEGLDATRALFAELKIKPAVVSLPVPFTRDDAAFQTGLKGLDEVGKFSAAIDCPRMIGILPAGSQTPKAELRKIIKDRATAMAEILARSKVRLGFEFLGPLELRTRQPHEFLWRMDETLDFCKECGPNVGLLLDAWHWYHAGATVPDILAAGKSRIVHIHVSDSLKLPPDQVRDSQRVLPGEGIIDLVAFFQALKQIGYEDGVSPEPLGRIPKDMPPEDGARMGLEATLRVMRQAGVI